MPFCNPGSWQTGMGIPWRCPDDIPRILTPTGMSCCSDNGSAGACELDDCAPEPKPGPSCSGSGDACGDSGAFAPTGPGVGFGTPCIPPGPFF